MPLSGESRAGTAVQCGGLRTVSVFHNVRRGNPSGFSSADFFRYVVMYLHGAGSDVVGNRSGFYGSQPAVLLDDSRKL